MTARGKKFSSEAPRLRTGGDHAARLHHADARFHGALHDADRRFAGDRQRDALFQFAALPGRLYGAQADPHRGGPDRRLHRQVQRRQHRPCRDAGRSPDGDERAGEGRRAAGRTLRHLGRRAGAEIRQQQAHHRRSDGQGPRRLPQDLCGLDPRLELLSGRRHHRAELQHPLDRRQRRRRRDRRPTASRARPAPACM